MGRFPDTCQHRIGQGKGQPKKVCGKSVRYVKPDSGDVVSVLIWEKNEAKFISLCCAPTVSRATKQELGSLHPDWREYRPAPEGPPDRVRQQWLRHALEEVGSARGNGLVRADNSDENLRYMPPQAAYVRRIG